jgi:hypothetical protein
LSALYPPKERRRLARRYRWAAAALWFVVAIFGLAVLGNFVGDSAGGIRDDVHPLAAILGGLIAGGTVVFALAVVHSRSAAWKRAARVDIPPLLLRGTISTITHTRLASHLEIQVDGAAIWKFGTRDRNDTTSVPGDPVTIELYSIDGKALGAYRNDRTGHVRATGTRIPT